MTDLQLILLCILLCLLAPVSAWIFGTICLAFIDEYRLCRLRQIRHHQRLHPPAPRRLRP
jgi:hypothetical protein